MIPMSEFTVTNVDLAELIPPDALAQLMPRRDGVLDVHVSTIAYRLSRAVKGTDYAEASDAGRAMHYMKGLAFEDVLGRAFADRRCRLHRPNGFRPDPMTFTIQGEGGIPDFRIIGTPDWCDLDDATGEMYTDDSKASSLSSRGDINGPKWFYARMQLKTYCAMTGSLRARILVLHLLGDYLYAASPSPGPHFRIYETRYTETQLVEHWDQVVVPEARRVIAERLRDGKGSGHV